MVKIVEELPPFLTKLINLTRKTDEKIAKWNEDGSIFVVVNEEEFKKTLKKYFKGTKQTFIRQLHFYGFKKVDTPDGAWGFLQENKLFLRDNVSLVTEIKRKKKIDPDTQRIATYTEVQALRNQVGFCQEIIEDLRTEILSLRNQVSSGKIESPPVKAPKKRMRPSKSMDFEEMCSKVNIKDMSELDLERLPSFSNTMDIDSDLENLSELFVDMDLEPMESQQLKRIPSYQKSLIEDSSNFTQAVEAVAEATKVKKSDVSKIISFLSQLSMKDQRNLDLKKELRAIDGHFHKARVQKVGAS